MGRACLIALIVLAVTAPPARAAEVRVGTVRVCEGGECVRVDEARYNAAPGEANELVVVDDFGGFTFRDRVPLTAGPGCSALPDGSVSCRTPFARADLGDGDDRASTGDPEVFASVTLGVDGGEGADVLTGVGQLAGGAGDDRLTGTHLAGGDGSDVLAGTGGVDYLVGGSGSDTLAGGPNRDQLVGDGRGAVPAPDVLDGGPGDDAVSYYGHRASVHVDLGNPVGADGDRLTGIESAIGGAGSDILTGDGGPNRLSGRRGRDMLLGGGGDDRLWGGHHADTFGGGTGDDTLAGGPGPDYIGAGPGDDTIDSGPGGADRDALHARPFEGITCGRGRDAVTRPGLSLIPPSCERVDGQPPYPRAAPDGRLTFTLVGAERWRHGRLELRFRGERIAAVRFAAGSERLRLRLRVPDRIRRLRRWPVDVEVRVFARDRYPYFLPYRLRWVFDLTSVR